MLETSLSSPPASAATTLGQRLSSTLVAPVLTAGALGAFFLVIQTEGVSGLDKAQAVFLLISVPVGALVLLLELLIPWRAAWKYSMRDVRQDAFWTVFNEGLCRPLLLQGLLLVVAVWAAQLAARFGASLWPSHLPLLIQMLLAILLRDLVTYWTHRAAHAIKLLWRVHSVHHTPEKLTFLKSLRSHPLDDALRFSGFVPLMLLGAGEDLFLGIVVISNVVTMLSHSNLGLDWKFFGLFFVTAPQHRLHHSAEWDESLSNFGDVTIVWDRVFGTYRAPTPTREATLEVGVEGMRPESVLDQLLLPFTRSF